MSVESRIAEAVQNGLTITQAAAIVGVVRSSAYLLAKRAGVETIRPIDDEKRREILEHIERGEGSLSSIAEACGVCKTSVLRVRDSAARAGARAERFEFRQTRSSYECPECGRLVRVVPCVACVARAHQCRPGG